VAAVVWSDVTAIDAALSTVASGAQTMLLASANALAAGQFDGVDGPDYKLARVYYAAHHGRRLLEATSAPGAVTSESVGDMSTSYAAPSGGGSDRELATTRWGLAYLALTRRGPGRFGGAG
jgi:hypothetical protein